jgi:hypothetical protein
VSAGYELKVAADLLVATHGEKALFLHGLEQHGLLVQTELADLVEKQHAFMRRAQQASTVCRRPGERSLSVAEQGGGRAVTTQGGAVDLDKIAGHLVARFLELEDAPRQMRLARTRGTGEKNRCTRANRHALYLFNQLVELRVARGNA